jgi:hypothetical protein
MRCGVGTHPGQPAQIIAWRRRQLETAGFAPALAAQLAARPGTDLHALCSLLDRGCPPELAARILDPTTVTTDRTGARP